MNDFTKDELELIELYFIKEDVVPDKPYIHLSLLRKIQYMLGNHVKPEKLMWISVADELPKRLQKVLFFWVMEGHLKNVSMGFRDEAGWRVYLPYTSYALNPEFIEVTHWMELPDYPDAWTD